MLRLALILGLLAALIALGVSLGLTKPNMTELAKTLSQTQSDLTASQNAKVKADSEAKAAKLLAEKSAKELSETKQELETASANEVMQHTRADKLANDLSKTSKERNEAREELSRWELTGIKPEQVAVMKSDIKKVNEMIAVVESEKKLLSRKVDTLESRLHRYEADIEPPVEMPGLRGKVLAVDSKWNFIVIDVGNDVAKENGIVIIRHDDQLVGKARIVRVEAQRSFANILPEWQQANYAVAEGDSVLY